ncbi:MAG: PKD domain-containing protein [Methanomicrobiales archaeon]|jgi:PKD repeat protein
MTAINAAGSDISTEDEYITVSSASSALVASFTGTPTSGIAPLTVQFTDTSSGSPTSWSWDFGDGGSSTDQNPGYTYTTGGNYTVSLTATDAEGSDTATEDEYITVSSAPVASFTGSPTSGSPPLFVQFTDTSSGSPTSWNWDFGDGGSSTDQNPSYTYTTPGTYTVFLIATNDEGSNTSTEENYITVGAVPTAAPILVLTLVPTTAPPPSAPVASFIDDPILGSAPLTVQFTDLSDGSPTSWHWDFGDGGTSTDQNPSYTYTTPGSYTVTLTDANSAGSSTSTGTDKITVLSPASSTPLSPLAAVMAMGIAAIAYAGIRGRKQQ